MSHDDSEDRLLQQYEFYAATANDVSDRRLRTNRFYVSLLSAILVVIPFFFELDALESIHLMALAVIGAVGLGLCVLWFFNIWSYKQLNSGKYRVIQQMESKLPFACYDQEWEELDRGRNWRTYLTHWKVERLVPGLMAIPYLFLVVFGLGRLL